MTPYVPPLAPSLTIVWLVGLSAGVALLATILLVTSGGRWQGRVGDFASDALGLSLMTLFAILFFAFLPVTLQFYIPALFVSAWAAPIGAFLGIALFLLRKRSLATYGAVEVGGALLTLGVVGFTDFGTLAQRAAAFLGAIYFLVRGLDNAEKGELLAALRRRPGRSLGFTALVVVATAMVVTMNNPPGANLQSARGGYVPVSPMACGELFVVCDENAWRERERLVLEGPAARAAAEAEAARRFQELHRR